MSFSTQLSCRGNDVNYKVCEQYYKVEKNTLTLDQNKKICDDSIVKHCIVLAQPSLCDEWLQILYQNQLATLDSIWDEDAMEEYNTHKVCGFVYVSSMALTPETEEVHNTELVSFTNKQEYWDQWTGCNHHQFCVWNWQSPTIGCQKICKMFPWWCW